MISTKSILLGIALGGVIGGISGLLTSPTSGRDLRNNLINNKEKLVNTYNQLIEDGLNVKDQMIKASVTGKQFVTTFSSEMKGPFETWSSETVKSKLKIEEELRQIDQSIQKLEQTISSK